MRRYFDSFSRWHLVVAAVVWLAFTLLTFLIVVWNLDNAGQHPVRVAVTTAASVLGPMTGAISRDFQSCCLAFSLSLVPYCGGALLTGVAAQFLPGKSAFVRGIRLLLWTGGLVVWFGGGIVSFGHALS